MSGRYNPGYRHWVEGCLQHGAKLYLGKLDSAALKRIDQNEQFLINKYGSQANRKIQKNSDKFNIKHSGDILEILVL